jgi:hypothetical protein
VPAAARERKREAGARKRRRTPFVDVERRRHQLVAGLNHPRRRRVDGRTHHRRHITIDQHGQLSGNDRPRGQRQPPRRVIDEHVGDARRIERGVDGAHEAFERIGALDTADQRPLQRANPGGEVDGWCARRMFAGTARFRSAFARGADGAINGDGHSGGATD